MTFIHSERMIILIILIGGICITNAIPIQDNRPICTDPVCEAHVNMLKARVDRTANPCLDFYDYACGLFTNADYYPILTPIDKIYVALKEYTNSFFEGPGPVVKSEVMMKVVFPKTRQIYNRCLDIGEEGVKFLKKKISNFCWSFVRDDCAYSKNDVVDFIKLARAEGFFTNDFFSALVKLDPTNSWAHTIYLERPGMQSDEYGFMYEQVSFHTVYDSISDKLLYDIGILFGGDPAKLPEKIKALRRFHATVVKAWSKYNVQNNAKLMSFKALDKVSKTYVNWTKIVENIVTPSTIHPRTIVVATCLPCLIEISHIIRSPNKLVLEYLIMGMVIESIPHVSQELRKQLITTPEEFCQSTLAKYFHRILDFGYHQSHSKQAKKNLIEDMFENMKKRMAILMNRNKIIQLRPRRKSIRKIRAMDIWFDHTQQGTQKAVLEDFKQWRFTENITFFEAILAVRKDFWYEMYGRYNLNPNPFPLIRFKKYFASNSLDVRYHRENNMISLPAASVLDALINPVLPSVVTYSLMGTILAHEMAHAFDNENRMYEIDGNDNRTFEAEDYEVLKWTDGCFLYQYGSTPNSETWEEASKTLSENIADTGGAYIAYSTFISRNISQEARLRNLTEFNDKQLFWLSYASRFCSKYSRYQVIEQDRTGFHSINRHRVNQVVSNIDAFSKDFKCPPCSSMNPIRKCNLFDAGPDAYIP